MLTPTVVPSIYLFVDAGYLTRVYSDCANKWFQRVDQLDYKEMFDTLGGRWRRAFYYDCKVIKKKSESEEEYNTRQNDQQSLWEELYSIDGCHIRHGHLTGEKRQRQKEVDILLAVDMLSHAARQNINKAILISGDRDFKPLVEAIVNTGVLIDIVADENSISMELARSADNFRRLSLKDYHNWTKRQLREQFPLPQTRNFPNKPGNILSYGTFANGFKVSIRENGSSFHADAPSPYDTKTDYIFHDFERLKTYLELSYGSIKWEQV